jgi:phage terminase small subunit
MARQKITDSTDELPEITEKEMAFCRLLVEENITASNAYRQAIEPECDKQRAWNASHRLKADKRIQQFINYLRAEAGKATSCTLIEHMQELERLRNVAEASGNLGAAVQAEQLRGKVTGHYVDQIKNVAEDMDDKGLVEAIGKLLGPVFAKEAAKKLGLESVTLQ